MFNMYIYRGGKKWLFDVPTECQIRFLDDIVRLIPESEEERKKCTTRGLASKFINKYKNRYNRIKKDRTDMLEEETWTNVSNNN